MNELDIKNIPDGVKNGKNIIYGASYNGRSLYRKLTDAGVSVDAFYDDDPTKWEMECCSVRILNKEEFINSADSEANIIIASVYTGQILERLKELDVNGTIYTIIGVVLAHEFEEQQFEEYRNDKTILNGLEYLAQCFREDVLSYRYFSAIKETFETQKVNKAMAELYCGQKQYFLDSFSGKMAGFCFADIGAYTGDTIRVMEEFGMRFPKVYAFEANPDNYKKLLMTKAELGRRINLTAENMAVWDSETMLGIEREGFMTRVSFREELQTKVHTVTIDNYFKDKHVDFIKMDIEGAECRALEGGWQVMKRDRPVLAISIYHSVKDVVTIPTMLMEKMEDYLFFVRCHSYGYSEAVLYGVPSERKTLLESI